MIHPDFVLPKVPPAPPPSDVLPDQYIPDLAYDSDSTESMPAIFPPNEPIANNDDISTRIICYPWITMILM